MDKIGEKRRNNYSVLRLTAEDDWVLGGAAAGEHRAGLALVRPEHNTFIVTCYRAATQHSEHSCTIV